MKWHNPSPAGTSRARGASGKKWHNPSPAGTSRARGASRKKWHNPSPAGGGAGEGVSNRRLGARVCAPFVRHTIQEGFFSNRLRGNAPFDHPTPSSIFSIPATEMKFTTNPPIF